MGYPFYHFNDSDVVEVTMLGPTVRQFQEWLNERQLHLFKIPGMPDDENHFGIGINDDHPAISILIGGKTSESH